MRLLKCLFQGMSVCVSENLEGGYWVGFCYGIVKEQGEQKYLIEPLDGDQKKPILIPLNDIYLWASTKQRCPEGMDEKTVSKTKSAKVLKLIH